MINKNSLLGLLLVSCSSFVNFSSNIDYIDKIRSDQGITVGVRGMALSDHRTPSFLKELYASFGSVYSPLRSSVVSVTLTEKVGELVEGDIDEFPQARSDSQSRSLELGLNNDHTVGTISHEMGHVYLDNILGFQQRWDSIVLDGELHESSYLLLSTNFPADGFMSRYGANKKFQRDNDGKIVRDSGGVALYCFYEDPPEFLRSIYDNSGLFSKVDVRDIRYMKKLELLLEVGAISEQQFMSVTSTWGDNGSSLSKK